MGLVPVRQGRAVVWLNRKELQMSDEYVPFGDEWKKEIMCLKKSEIVDMLTKALRENASRPIVCPECGGIVEFCGMGHYVPVNMSHR
jgi:hypothetical protein